MKWVMFFVLIKPIASAEKPEKGKYWIYNLIRIFSICDPLSLDCREKPKNIMLLIGFLNGQGLQ